MTPEKHRMKAERIERSLRKCADADYEIRIEGAMLAATHWLNCSFHSQGVTRPDQDVMHTYMLTVNEFRRLSVADERLVRLLAEIEDLRPLYVRGDIAGGEKIAGHVTHLLAEIRAIAEARIRSPGKS